VSKNEQHKNCPRGEDLMSVEQELDNLFYDRHAEIKLLHGILRQLRKLNHLFQPRPEPSSAIITQGANMLTGKIKGLAPGASDTFFVTPIDVNGNADALPVGSAPGQFSADDASVVLTPAADGLSTQAQAPAAAAADGSFNLTWKASFTKLDGTAGSISKSVNVPYLAPPTFDPVDAVISQGAPAA
jgi:hypothetical protein